MNQGQRASLAAREQYLRRLADITRRQTTEHGKGDWSIASELLKRAVRAEAEGFAFLSITTQMPQENPS